LPDSPNHEQQDEADKLGRLFGHAFDREYLQYEAKDHRKDVKEQGKEMKQTTDPDLKAFAAAAHRTVLAHRTLVDDLVSKTKK
jgi:putative membrane protein